MRFFATTGRKTRARSAGLALAVCTASLLAGPFAQAQNQTAMDAVRHAAEEQQRNQEQHADRDQAQRSDQAQSASDEAFTVKPERGHRLISAWCSVTTRRKGGKSKTWRRS